MVDDHFTLTVERLRDDLGDLKVQLRKKYKASGRQVVSENLKSNAARLAESWMVNIGPRREVQNVLSADVLGDLNVRFQRLLTFSEHATKRSRYDTEITVILKRFSLEVLIPLKQAVAAGAAEVPQTDSTAASRSDTFSGSAFVGHSFAPADEVVNTAVISCLQNLGIAVETGNKPKADRISDKVRRLIDRQFIFVGIFTKRDKIARKSEWTTSPWVIDEKAYAVGVNKRLVLLSEGAGDLVDELDDPDFLPPAMQGIAENRPNKNAFFAKRDLQLKRIIIVKIGRPAIHYFFYNGNVGLLLE